MISLSKSKEHPFDVILVWKYSRFARNQEESIVYKSLLKKNNVEVISISEPLIDGPFGSLIERIIEWMDEYYSIRLSGEVKRGMTENAMRGTRQTRTPFGYIYDNGNIIVDEKNRAFIVKIFEDYVYRNMSFYAIAKELNNLGALTIHGNPFFSRPIKYILDNPVYCGLVMWGVPFEYRNKRNKIDREDVIVREGNHEPIISRELFDLAQARLKREYKHKALPPESQIHWLSAMLRCSSCGRTLVSNGGQRPGFQCSGYKKHQCTDSHYIRTTKIEKALLGDIKEASQNRELEYTNIASIEKSSELEALYNALEKCEKKESRIKDSYRNGIDTLEEYKEHKQIISNERQDILKQIEEIESLSSTQNVEKMMQRISNVYDILTSETASRNDKNAAIKSIISEIVYDKKSETIKIYYFLS